MKTKNLLMSGIGALLITVSACSSGGDSTSNGTTGGGAGTTTGGGGNSNDGGLVALAVRVATPSNRTLYLNAFPSMPTGTLDLTNWLQFPVSDFFFAYGDAFVWDRTASTYTKYSADSNGALVKGQSMSLANIGITGFRQSFFISPTLAYDFDSQATVVSWNPQTMSIIDHQAYPELGTTPPGGDPDAGYTLSEGNTGAAQVSNYMAMPIGWASSDRSHYDNHLDLAMIDTTNLHNEAQILQDSRCSGTTSVFTDENGDLYATGTALSGSYQVFPPSGVTVQPACVLRIKQGTSVFDPDYKLDLLAATGDQAVFQTYYAGKGKLLVIALKKSYVPTTPSDLSKMGTWEAFLVDMTAMTSMPLPSLPVTATMNNRPLTVNGQLYFQNYNAPATGSQVATNITVFKVDPDGTVTQGCSTSGDFWNIGAMSMNSPE